MANLLTVDELREHIETGLNADALGRLNDDADLAVIRSVGPLAVDSQVFAIAPCDYPDGRDKVVTLTRELGTVTEITEQIFDNTPDVLAADDYVVDGSQLTRLDTGTNPRSYWGHRVTVTIAPLDTTATRKIAIVDLVKLEVQFQGLADETAGDYRMTAPEYLEAKKQVLAKLTPGMGFGFA